MYTGKKNITLCSTHFITTYCMKAGSELFWAEVAGTCMALTLFVIQFTGSVLDFSSWGCIVDKRSFNSKIVLSYIPASISVYKPILCSIHTQKNSNVHHITKQNKADRQIQCSYKYPFYFLISYSFILGIYGTKLRSASTVAKLSNVSYKAAAALPELITYVHLTNTHTLLRM